MQKLSFLQKISITFLCFLFINLLTFYLFQTGRTVEASYLIKTYQASLEKSQVANADLRARFLDKLSLNNIEEKAKELSFTSVNEIKYIELSGASLAENFLTKQQ